MDFAMLEARLEDLKIGLGRLKHWQGKLDELNASGVEQDERFASYRSSIDSVKKSMRGSAKRIRKQLKYS